MRDFVGMNIGRYHLVEQLGVGGMATVYKAFDTRLERQVAIKIIRREAFPAEQLDRVLKRFDREAKTLAQLTHPNIVGIIDYGDIEGSPYLVMEYLAGGTLKQRLGKPVAYREAFQLLLPVAQALAYAHQKGVVHRDVKPANILITEGGQPMLTDFGIAKILEDDGGATLTGTGVGVGTPEYMAPEQGMGREIDGRADVYALGVVLYELVTGHKPYTADTPMAVVVKHLTDPLPRPKDAVPDLPDWVEQIILKALAKKPEDRYQNMADFAAALAKIEAHPLGSPAAAASFLSTLPQSEPDLADEYEDETGEATMDMGETPPAAEDKPGTAALSTSQPIHDAAGIPSQKVPLSYSEAVENDTGELTRDPGGGQPSVSPMPVQPARPKDFGRPTTTHGSGSSTINKKTQAAPDEAPPHARWKIRPWHGWALAAVIVIAVIRILTISEPTPGAVPGTVNPVLPTVTTEAPSTGGSAAKFKIGILAPAVTHGWVAAVAYNAEVRAKELADTVEYKLYTSSNAEEMTTQLDDLLTWGAQAIVAFPQWQGMEVPIQAAIDKGVKVVNFDIEIAANGVYRVSGDNKDMGIQGAKYIVDKIGKTGTVVMLEVPTSGSVSELRKAGFVETLAEIAPDMTVISYATKFTREDGLKDMADILTKNPQIDAVYSMDDETSIGALQAIKEANRTDIKVITGGGGMQEYFKMMPENQNIWIESALYSPAMVKDAVDMAVALLKGEKVDPVKIIPTTLVDRDNYTKFLDANSPY